MRRDNTKLKKTEDLLFVSGKGYIVENFTDARNGPLNTIVSQMKSIISSFIRAVYADNRLYSFT